MAQSYRCAIRLQAILLYSSFDSESLFDGLDIKRKQPNGRPFLNQEPEKFLVSGPRVVHQQGSFGRIA
jgi:hypothetical protein